MQTEIKKCLFSIKIKGNIPYDDNILCVGVNNIVVHWHLQICHHSTPLAIRRERETARGLLTERASPRSQTTSLYEDDPGLPGLRTKKEEHSLKLRYFRET